MVLSNSISLRVTLINRLLPAMLILLVVGAVAAYWTALRAATKAYDRGLLDTAFTISEQIVVLDGKLQLPLSPQARSVLLTDKFDRIYYAVRNAESGLLDGNPDLQEPRGEGAQRLADEGRAYYNGLLGGTPIRLAALQKVVAGRQVTILAAETMVKRNELVRDTLLGMLLPGLLLIAVSASVIWFGVRSGLSPLDTLRRELANRSPADLSPVNVQVPEEIQPVASEINGLLKRLDLALQSQRNFVSDAAHQLRTPIAALQAQVDSVVHDAGPHESEQLAGIRRATQRLSHLVEQLLALARAEPDLPMISVPVDLLQLVHQLAEEWLPRAIARDIDLGFELSPAYVSGNALLLQELLANLLDNALRHTPKGGMVTVSCGLQGDQAQLLVEDSGPGISAAERIKVFDRFYRPVGQGGDGCGLGLAIVREVARHHGGAAEAAVSARLGGALIRVNLPAVV